MTRNPGVIRLTMVPGQNLIQRQVAKPVLPLANHVTGPPSILISEGLPASPATQPPLIRSLRTGDQPEQ
jgi:hypothetical protein